MNHVTFYQNHYNIIMLTLEVKNVPSIRLYCVYACIGSNNIMSNENLRVRLYAGTTDKSTITLVFMIS